MADQQSNNPNRVRGFELPSTYGAHIWNFLAQFGRCWTKKERWLSTISYVTDCLNFEEPGNHNSGCERCHNHWLRLTKLVPPSKVNNAIEAAVWVHFIHNQVNNLATPPKKPISYNQAAKTQGYGWALLQDEEYFAILESFGVKVKRAPKAKARAVQKTGKVIDKSPKNPKLDS